MEKSQQKNSSLLENRANNISTGTHYTLPNRVYRNKSWHWKWNQDRNSWDIWKVNINKTKNIQNIKTKTIKLLNDKIRLDIRIYIKIQQNNK